MTKQLMICMHCAETLVFLKDNLVIIITCPNCSRAVMRFIDNIKPQTGKFLLHENLIPTQF